MADARPSSCVGCGMAVSSGALRCPGCDRPQPHGAEAPQQQGEEDATVAPPPPPPPTPGLSDPKGPGGWEEQEDPYLGTLVNGQYRVERRIGVGGMGAVYLAQEEGMRRQVAVKVMTPRPYDSPGRQKRFQREAQAASCIYWKRV